MMTDLSSDASEFGLQARRALQAAGGDQLVQEAEADPRARAKVEPVLRELGAWDLDPLTDAEELEAAAALCRSAGYWSVPFPLAEVLSRPRGFAADAMVVVAGRGPAAPADGLDLSWVAVTVDGRRSRATPGAPVAAGRYATFLTSLDLEPMDTVGARELALGLVLPCWTLLGMLDRAEELACAYVQDRRQFGQPLASFQGVQFQLTDAEVERLGFEELAKYALWSIQTDREDVVTDALALRLAALEAANVVFRVTHQVHGAIGFCDETTLSWLSRYSLPLRRHPLDLSETVSELTRRTRNRPLEGIYS